MASSYADFTCACLKVLFCCRLPSGEKHDIAIVHLFKSSSWKPKTNIDGCQVLEEVNEPQFVMLKYLIRGAHMIPVFDTKDGRFMLNDLIDSDMFLHAGN